MRSSIPVAGDSQVQVNGRVAQFTLLVMTYSARLSLLHRFTRHYSQCKSVGSLSNTSYHHLRGDLTIFALALQVAEILVVWNEGAVSYSVPSMADCMSLDTAFHLKLSSSNVSQMLAASGDNLMALRCQMYQNSSPRYQSEFGWRRRTPSTIAFVTMCY